MTWGRFEIAYAVTVTVMLIAVVGIALWALGRCFAIITLLDDEFQAPDERARYDRVIKQVESGEWTYPWSS